jgi:hypothetical protein
MNSPKEPEPDPAGALFLRSAQAIGRILWPAFRASEGYVPGIALEGFIGG